MEQLRKRRSGGFSLIELLIVIAIILIILAIAVPKLGSARMNANEMAVIREMQTINTMQTQYMSQFQRFATTLAELGPACQRRTRSAGCRPDSRHAFSGGEGRIRFHYDSHAFRLHAERESQGVQHVGAAHVFTATRT